MRSHLDDTRWRQMAAEITAYARQHGRVLPPITEHPRLHTFVRNVRAAYHHGRLRADRASLMEAIPHWRWRDIATVRRDRGEFRGGTRYQQIAAWLSKHGRLPRANSTDPEEQQIHQLAARIRVEQRCRRLPPATVAAFEALPGWTWDSPSSATALYVELAADFTAYTTRHGHRPARAGDARYRLNNWWYTRRTRLAELPTDTPAQHLLVAALTVLVTRLEQETVPYQWWASYQRNAAAGRPYGLTRIWAANQQRQGGLNQRQQALITEILSRPSPAQHHWRRWASAVRANPTAAKNKRWLALRRRQLADGQLNNWQREVVESLGDLPRPARKPTAPTSFGDANRDRILAAAAAKTRAAAAALADPDLPAHLREAVQARLDHPTLSLAEIAAVLGCTKDAYSSALRRALAGEYPASRAG